jgi:hypothetical protein
MSENSNENRLDTINISDDLESQVENLNFKILGSYQEKPLKGILKKQSSFAEEEETNSLNRTVKLCAIVLIIILFVPIICCDIYFGFTDNSCINEIATGLNFTMKIYLLVSGFIGLASVIFTICLICLISDNETKLPYAKIFGLISLLFQIIWNLLGSATFWGTLYKEGNCDLTTSTYIYVSLIIKLVCNLLNLRQILQIKK